MSKLITFYNISQLWSMLDGAFPDDYYSVVWNLGSCCTAPNPGNLQTWEIIDETESKYHLRKRTLFWWNYMQLPKNYIYIVNISQNNVLSKEEKAIIRQADCFKYRQHGKVALGKLVIEHGTMDDLIEFLNHYKNIWDVRNLENKTILDYAIEFGKIEMKEKIIQYAGLVNQS